MQVTLTIVDIISRLDEQDDDQRDLSCTPKTFSHAALGIDYIPVFCSDTVEKFKKQHAS